MNLMSNGMPSLSNVEAWTVKQGNTNIPSSTIPQINKPIYSQPTPVQAPVQHIHITEEQANAMGFVQPVVTQYPVIPITNTPVVPVNVIDTLGNLTLGTVNRAAKAITGLVNAVVDVVTFGYGTK